MPGDYYVVSDPTRGLAAIINEIRNAPLFSSTGKRLHGANARRRRQFRRGSVGGIGVASYDFWRSRAYNGDGRVLIDVIDCQ